MGRADGGRDLCLQRCGKDVEKLYLRSHVYFGVTRATYNVCGDVQKMRVMQWFQPRVTLSPRDVWLSGGEGGEGWPEWDLVGEGQRYGETMLRAAPTTNNDRVPDGNRAKIGKPQARERRWPHQEARSSIRGTTFFRFARITRRGRSGRETRVTPILPFKVTCLSHRPQLCFLHPSDEPASHVFLQLAD